MTKEVLALYYKSLYLLGFLPYSSTSLEEIQIKAQLTHLLLLASCLNSFTVMAFFWMLY